MNWIEQVLRSPEFSMAAFPAAFVLGFLTAVTSSCNLGIIAAVVGYAGSRDEQYHRRDAFMTAVSFMIGTVVALALLGLLIGHVGGLAGASFKRYSTLIMGFAVIVAGLAALKLMPFRLPSVNWSKVKRPSGRLGSIVFGFVIGTASLACTAACCGPLVLVVLGMTAISGQALRGSVILGLFAIGYGLPLAALMLGIGLGRSSTIAQKLGKPIRVVAGSGLLVVGFWLLATM